MARASYDSEFAKFVDALAERQRAPVEPSLEHWLRILREQEPAGS